ncbi:MAG: cupin domain-containing protein [Chloroflexota bacterium]
MPEGPSYISDLVSQVGEIPPDSILSRTLFSSDQVKVTLFGFAAGQELSEHTASMPAILHFLSGSARLTLGGETHSAGPGTWVHMPGWLKHSVYAETPVVMLLLLLKGGQLEG